MLKQIKVIKKFILASGVIASLFFAPHTGLAQTVYSAPAFIRTPAQLSSWLEQEFKYVTEMPDYWQSAQETLDLKSGDCEDFAILAQAVLNRLGIANDIVIIKFKGLNQTHALCIFKEGSFYSFLSNQKLVRTQAKDLQSAIQQEYPDWEKIIFTDAQQKCLKVIAKALPSEPVNSRDLASASE